MMDPSNAQHQAMGTHSLEDVIGSPKSQQERRPTRPPPEHALNCPRCDSSNTKFCYYNNYSLSQPRYFCKACRRYWTKGGSLRNVPVGGGCRKNKRSSSSKRTQEQHHSTNSNPLSLLPPITYDSNDLSLSFGGLLKQPTRQLLGLHDHDTSILGNFNTSGHCDIFGNPNTTPTTSNPGFLDSLRSGFLDVPSGFHNFCYGFGNQNMGEVGSGGEEMVLPYEEMSGAAAATTTTTSPAIATTTTTKHEFYNGKDGENRVFWNFPWQFGGEGGMGSVDSGRECWNGGLGSSWHGLVNSPLI